MAALHGAIALVQVHHVAMLVRQDLDLHVSRVRHKALCKHGAVPAAAHNHSVDDLGHWCLGYFTTSECHTQQAKRDALCDGRHFRQLAAVMLPLTGCVGV